jgi:hypothetical protein
MGLDQALEYLKSKDPQLDREVDGAFPGAGAKPVCPACGEGSENPAESVLVFAPGYYD